MDKFTSEMILRYHHSFLSKLYLQFLSGVEMIAGVKIIKQGGSRKIEIRGAGKTWNYARQFKNITLKMYHCDLTKKFVDR